MNEVQLRQHTDCHCCGRKVLHTGLPMFWTVTIERHGVKIDAVKRQDGLAALMGGNSRLARVMGPDEDMTQPLMEPVTATICEACATDRVTIAALAENVTNAAKPGARSSGPPR